MKANILTICLLAVLLVMACQLVAPKAPTTEPTPNGQLQTQAAAEVYAGLTATAGAGVPSQSATAEAELAKQAAQTATAQYKRVLFGIGLTADAQTAAASLPVFNVSVPASACWMNSEVIVSAGQTVSITASGMVNTYDGDSGSNADPDGQANVCGGSLCPVLGVPYGALVGRVGDGKAFLIGSELEFVTNQDGQLHFTTNDWECADNSGQFDIVITVK